MNKLPLCPWPMRALGLSLVVLSVVMIGCQSASEPEVDAPLPNFLRGRPTESVTGSGQFTQPPGGLRTFAFSALDQGGTVSGTFAGFNPMQARSVKGIVTCFEILPGNQAWIAGPVTQSSDGVGVGVDHGFHVIDNGRGGRPTPDQISGLRAVASLGLGLTTAAEFCAFQPTPAQLPIKPVEAGDIQVRD